MGQRGRIKSRNIYKGPKDKDYGGGRGGLNVGGGEWVWQGRVMGEKWGQL